MSRPRLTRLAATLALIVGLPVAGAAQASSTFPDLPRLLRPGDRIVLVDSAGLEFPGRVERLGPADIVVALGGRSGRRDHRRFVVEDIRRITRHGDGLTNGVLIGLGAGAAFGCVTAAGFSGETRAGDCVAGGLMFGAMGLAIGLGLDALVTAAPVLVYEHPGRSVSFEPLLGPQVAAARVALRW